MSARERSPGALWGLVALGLLLACSVSPARLREPASVEPAPVASGLDTGFRSVEARGQGLELLLPDADGWRHDPRDTRAWVATHTSTRSRLLARSWRADSIVRAGDCQRQLRELRPDLPTLGPEQQLERRQLRVAGDYAAELGTGAVASGRAGAIAGHAHLFGSNGRQCLALVFTTSAESDTAAREVGERLGIISQIFERVRRLDISARVVVPRP